MCDTSNNMPIGWLKTMVKSKNIFDPFWAIFGPKKAHFSEFSDPMCDTSNNMPTAWVI